MSDTDHQAESRQRHLEQQLLWQRIIELSAQLLNGAQRSDWSLVDTVSLEREALLERFFGQAIESTMVDIVQEGIVQLRHSDEEIVRLVKKNRAELAGEIADLQARKKHIKDYMANST